MSCFKSKKIYNYKIKNMGKKKVTAQIASFTLVTGLIVAAFNVDFLCDTFDKENQVFLCKEHPVCDSACNTFSIYEPEPFISINAKKCFYELCDDPLLNATGGSLLMQWESSSYDFAVEACNQIIADMNCSVSAGCDWALC